MIIPSFHSKELRNREIIPTFFPSWVTCDSNAFLSVTNHVYAFLQKLFSTMSEHSGIHRVIDNSSHCLWIRVKIWAILTVLKIAHSSALFLLKHYQLSKDVIPLSFSSCTLFSRFPNPFQAQYYCSKYGEQFNN